MKNLFFMRPCCSLAGSPASVYCTYTVRGSWKSLSSPLPPLAFEAFLLSATAASEGRGGKRPCSKSTTFGASASAAMAESAERREREEKEEEERVRLYRAQKYRRSSNAKNGTQEKGGGGEGGNAHTTTLQTAKNEIEQWLQCPFVPRGGLHYMQRDQPMGASVEQQQYSLLINASLCTHV